MTKRCWNPFDSISDGDALEAFDLYYMQLSCRSAYAAKRLLHSRLSTHSIPAGKKHLSEIRKHRYRTETPEPDPQRAGGRNRAIYPNKNFQNVFSC